MVTELEELLGFLSSPSPQVKKVAVDIVGGLTGSEDGLQSLANFAEASLPPLSHLLGEKKEISEPAGEALVNLSQNSDMTTKMIAVGMIKRVMDTLYKQGSEITRLLVMLLVNLTQLDDDDPYEHVGSILVNISKQETGRKILLDPKLGLLKQIIRQFDSGNLLRKKGVSGTIRNCCFEAAESQLQNLLLASEFLWPALLLPVSGSTIYSKQDTSKMPSELGSALSVEREGISDPEIRVQALEAIYLLSLQDAGQRALWSINGPRILQVGYKEEKDPKVMEAYEQIGSLLVHSSSGAGKPVSETTK